jgi:hypothetical protein
MQKLDATIDELCFYVIRAEMLQGKDKVSSVPEAVKKIVARVLS